MIRFFCDNNFKLWSDHGHLAKLNGISDVLNYISFNSADSDWELYRPAIYHHKSSQRFVDGFSLSLSSDKIPIESLYYCDVCQNSFSIEKMVYDDYYPDICLKCFNKLNAKDY